MKALEYMESIGCGYGMATEKEAKEALIDSHERQRRMIQLDNKIKNYCYSKWYLRKILDYVMDKVNAS